MSTNVVLFRIDQFFAELATSKTLRQVFRPIIVEGTHYQQIINIPMSAGTTPVTELKPLATLMTSMLTVLNGQSREFMPAVQFRGLNQGLVHEPQVIYDFCERLADKLVINHHGVTKAFANTPKQELPKLKQKDTIASLGAHQDGYEDGSHQNDTTGILVIGPNRHLAGGYHSIGDYQKWLAETWSRQNKSPLPNLDPHNIPARFKHALADTDYTADMPVLVFRDPYVTHEVSDLSYLKTLPDGRIRKIPVEKGKHGPIKRPRNPDPNHGDSLRPFWRVEILHPRLK